MPNPAEFIHGPMLIGTTINFLLFGIMITQMYIYYTTYKRDSMAIKLFVFVLFVVDAVNVIFGNMYMYKCLIIHFGEAAYLEKTDWSAEIVIASTVLVTLMVQVFYAWRIHVLTRNGLLVAVVTLVSVTSAVFGFIVVWETTVKVLVYTRMLEIKDIITVWLSCAVVADIMISVILIRHLQRKHRSGFRQTDMSINRIIRVTMQTCLATTVAAILDLALFLGVPSGSYIALTFILSKLYSNSLISSLNSRGGWNFVSAATPESEITDFNCARSDGQVDITTHYQPSTTKPWAIFNYGIGEKNTRAGVVVHVEAQEMQDVARRVRDPEA